MYKFREFYNVYIELYNMMYTRTLTFVYVYILCYIYMYVKDSRVP